MSDLKAKQTVEFVGGPMDGQSLEIHGGYAVPELQLEFNDEPNTYVREYYETGKAHFVWVDPSE